MLNNVVSQTQHQSLKPFKKDNKADEQIQQLSERLDALSTDIVTEQITVDNITVNSKITSQAAEIDNVATKLVSTDNLEASSASLGTVHIENAEVDAITTSSLTANKIDVDDLTIAGNLQLNTVQSSSATATTGHFDTLTFGGATTENVSITNDNISVGGTIIQSNKITTAEIDTPLVETDSVNSHIVSADTKIETPLINTTLLNADKVDVNEAAINSIITKTLENSELIKHTGKLNLDPEQLSIYDWYAVDVKLGNYTVYLRSTYKTINDEEQTFHITIIGTEQSAVICYDETNLGQIVDFSFDNDSGTLRIRFHGTEWLYYGISTLDEEPLPLDVIYNAEDLMFFHEPKRMRGYVFQSYNDNSVEFYFGGEVFVHSLSAEFQEFEEQMTKKLYVEKTILFPREYNPDESIRTWNPGLEGEYITNRVNEFGHETVTWEDKTTIINDSKKDHLIDADAVINYNGDVVTPNDDPALVEHDYPIVHLGDETVTHGQHKIEGNVITKHIFDGKEEDMPLMPDNSLVIRDTEGTEDIYQSYSPDFGDEEVWTEDSTGFVCNINTLFFTYDDAWTQLARVDFDGTAYTMVDADNNTVAGLDIYQKVTVPKVAKLTRKTTRSGLNKYDEVAVYESSKVLENNKPLIYNANSRSIQTTDEVVIDELEVNKLTVKEWLKSIGDTTTKHIYDGAALTSADLALRPDGSLYVDDTTNTLYRKSTNDDTTVRLDRLATLKDGIWTSKDGYTLVYDEATDSLKPTKDLSLNELDIAGDLRVGGDAYITGTLHYTQEELIESTSDFILLRANNSASLAVGEESGIAINNYDGTHTLAIATDRTGTARVGTGTGTSTTYNDIYYGLADNKWYSDAALTTEITPQGNLSSWTSIEKTDDYYHYTDAVFKVIDFTDMQAIATRDEEAAMSHNAITKWNADDKKLQTLPLPVRSEQTLEAVVTVDDTDPLDPITTVGYTWVDKKAGVLHFATEAAYTAYEATHNVPNDTLVIIDEYDTNLMGDNQI